MSNRFSIYMKSRTNSKWKNFIELRQNIGYMDNNRNNYKKYDLKFLAVEHYYQEKYL